MTPTLAPSVTRAPRLAPLAKLPIFLDLAGRRMLLVGGGEPVVWKAELLAAAGARLDVVAPEPHPDLAELAAASGGAVVLHRRAWRPRDLDGAAIVIADEEDEAEAARLRQAAQARGLLVNVIDKPAFCDFQFGTIVNRSPVVIGIMTDGAAPILGQAIRRRIEAVVPASLASWTRTAKGFRERLRALLPGRSDRRLFWEGFVDRALRTGTPETEQPAELERLAGSIAAGRRRESGIGEVVIVGAGPGDPELLTLKAMRELQAADVIVYDRLVTPGVLELARREARRIHVGKEGHGAACRQEDISSLVVDLALAGERVVRLKGGDPAVFGRTGEEVLACREAGVPVRIVPGVTTASAAAASLNVSLTHRDHAQRLQFVTGHDRHGELPADLDIAALANPRSTLVIYMGRRTAALLARKLIGAGLPGGTPVVALADVSRPEETRIAARLCDLAQGLVLPERRPVIIVIGAALAAAAETRLSGALCGELAQAVPC
ncbi:siroheme synthase CysG [Enterovirga aerilata]|uniref:Uroporphyrinogen-III C-methyltransferase n=1 Tax=Enterovirga aerilata TaxID=2730920 RepID=A0A849HV06_9HYPH|nr:siroheme synthase CysG [Enterovirga sp. DB1703]NNM71336.1 uroporphyrinogen-III C-methyltransferase [Enterovirga sp. DB1703]